jgi:hypothetical protein
MNVKELKLIIAGLPDETPVMFKDPNFTDYFEGVDIAVVTPGEQSQPTNKVVSISGFGFHEPVD